MPGLISRDQLKEQASLQDKVALITGGHLGSATALELAESGAKIAFTYHSDAKAAQSVISKLPGTGHRIYQADLQTEVSIKKLFEEVKSDFGHLHVAINNVGKVLKKPMANIDESEFDEMFTLNAKTAFFFIKYAGIHLEDGGRIVTTATALLAAFTGYYSLYAGAKAPVEHFTRAASKELGPRRISVNAIAPGPMDTPFFYGQENEESTAFLKSQAFGNRLTDVRDIAPIIKHLVSDGNWITGQTIFANGGFTTR